MEEVQKALRDAALAPDGLYGRRLINWALGQGKRVRLVVPLGEELQEHARTLFQGAFAYYRNYAAHEGDAITEHICARVMVLASELLDLVAASSRPFEGLETIDQLVDKGLFESREGFAQFLRFMSGQQILEDTVDGFFEGLYMAGWNDPQMEIVHDLGLIVWGTQDIIPSSPEEALYGDLPAYISHAELTPAGVRALELVERSASRCARDETGQRAEADDT